MDSSSQNTKPVLVSRKPQTKFLQETKLFTVLIPPAPARKPLRGTDSWDVAVPPPNGTTRNSHISQERPALRTPFWVQVHYTQVRGAEAWGPRHFHFLFMFLNFRGARCNVWTGKKVIRWEIEAPNYCFLAPSLWPRRGGRG